MSVVHDQGIPSTEVESWRNTDLTALESLVFAPVEGRDGIESIEGLPFLDPRAVRMVFSNGRLRKNLSAVEGLPKGVRLRAVSEMLAEDSSSLRNHLSGASAFRESVFSALNLAFTDEGAVIDVPEGMALETAIHLVFLNESESNPFMVNPRILVLAGENSQVTVIESHLGFTEGTYFVNSVTEIVAAENAVVDHYKVQREGNSAYHLGTVDAYLCRSSNVRTGTFTLGGKLTRNETKAELRGEGASTELNGLYLACRDQHVDNYTTITHAAPHCSSRELYKGILDDSARGVFRGRIVVAEGAQQTDSKQTNNNLLLSDNALVNTKPQLEIYADDVKCTHGATIGQMEDEAMFYLRTRGIGKEAARSMLIYAFANEALGEVNVPALQEQLHSFLSDWLPGGLS